MPRHQGSAVIGNQKTLIICKSVHHQNTARVAQAIANVLHAEICAPEDVPYARLNEYDLIILARASTSDGFIRPYDRWVREPP